MAAVTAASQTRTPFRIAATGTTAVTFPLEPDRHYDVYHTGLNTSEASAVGEVFFGVNGTTPTAAHAVGEELGSFVYGVGLIPLGPGVSSITLITAADSPVLQFYPSGSYQGRQ